jgi:hypothetical protein
LQGFAKVFLFTAFYLFLPDGMMQPGNQPYGIPGKKQGRNCTGYIAGEPPELQGIV